MNDDESIGNLVRTVEAHDVFVSPRSLITCGNRGKLTVVEETLRQLEKLGSKCHVIASVGCGRSGKSYLLNRLAKFSSEMVKARNAKKVGVLSWFYGTSSSETAEEPQTGFVLDHTTVSQRKGVWVWCRQHPTLDNHTLVLLDFDGFGDTRRKGCQNDHKMLALAALLSNTLVYNTPTALKTDDLEKLVLSCRVSNRIKRYAKTGEASADEKMSGKCKLVVCLRDFGLFLQDDDGQPITANDYLQACLQMRQSATEDGNMMMNQSGQCIRRHFADIKAFTLDRPGDRSLLQRLEEIPDNKLSKTFMEDADKFCSEVLEVDAKEMSCFTGQGLADIVRSYAAALDNDNFPILNDTMTSLTAFWNERALQQVVNEFRKQMEGVEIPVFSSRELLEKKNQLKTDLLRELQKLVEYDEDDVTVSRAERDMDNIAKKVTEKNSKLIQEKCLKDLQDMFRPLFFNIEQRKYHVAGGYTEFKKDVAAMVQTYMEDHSNVDQDERRSALDMFSSTYLNKESEQILLEDQKQTEVDHQTALLIKEEECFKLRQEAQDTFIRQIEDQQRRHDNEMTELNRKRKRDDDDDGVPKFIKRIFR